MFPIIIGSNIVKNVDFEWIDYLSIKINNYHLCDRIPTQS